MKQLRRKFDMFCFRNRDKGVKNLMLYLSLGSALVYLMNFIDPSNAIYNFLCFDREAIFHGQVWRLFTYPLCYDAGSIFWMAISLLCYYSLGSAIEHLWGTLRFNLFYLTGVVLLDVYCLIFDGWADASYLNLSLFLTYATIYPDAEFLMFFIIPVKAWILGVVDLVLMLMGIFVPFPYCLFPIIAIGNYFLFVGKDIVNLFPVSWRVNASRAAKKAAHPKSKTIPFNAAGSYQATHTTVKAPYTHKCTVCGRTDVDHPELEFRYCSRCKGYYCYCQDHISNHAHITE